MAGTTAPLFGLDASGTIGKALVFSRWRGRTYVRRHAVPANPNTPAQRAIRGLMKFVSQDWANLSTNDKETWRDLANVDNITLLNAQTRDAIKRAKLNQGWRKTPTATPGTTPDAPTGGAATAQDKTLILSWSAPGVNVPQYCYAVYMSTSSGFTPSIANLIGVVPVGTTTLTVDKLVNGTTYYFEVRGLNNDGEFGALSSEFNGTPAAA